jgi:hypothetical protein
LVFWPFVPNVLLPLGRREPQAGALRDWPCSADCCYDHSVLHAPLAQLAEQRTLNPRVRGSSPWRRTRTDLGFHRSRLFLCVRFVPMSAPCSLVSYDQVAAGLSNLAGSGPQRGRRRPSLPNQLSIPLVDVLSFGSLIQLLSVKPTGSVESHERIARQDAASWKCRAYADDGIDRSSVTSPGGPLRSHRRVPQLGTARSPPHPDSPDSVAIAVPG